MNGHFSEEALLRFAQLAAQAQSSDFSEEGTYDFTRCVRPNGTVYGTAGKCRKGTEQEKRLEQEIGRALGGGPFQVPTVRKPETEEQRKERAARVKKGLEIAKAGEQNRKVFDEAVGKMAESLLKSKGGNLDESVRSKNLVQNIKNNIKEANSAGGTKTRQVIQSGNLQGLLTHAAEIDAKTKEDHISARVKEIKEEQKAQRKEDLARMKARGASEEEISRYKRNTAYDQSKDLKRTKVAAEKEYYALYHILNPSVK